MMFRDRQDAAAKLAKALWSRPMSNPVVLAIPRGGVALGAFLAERLDAELDIALSRKLRAPHQPELAVGAITESGKAFINQDVVRATHASAEYLAEEKEYQLRELSRRKTAFRKIRPPASLQGRTVIVTDDGIATGSTMLAALQSIRAEMPREVLVAVPVAPPDRLAQLRPWCDEIVCLLAPENFRSVGQYYLNFAQLEDAEVVELLRENYRARGKMGTRDDGLPRDAEPTD